MNRDITMDVRIICNSKKGNVLFESEDNIFLACFPNEPVNSRQNKDIKRRRTQELAYIIDEKIGEIKNLTR